MALTTDLDIVNSACALFGEDAPQSFDDDLGNGQSAGLLYQSVIEFNLGIYLFSWSRQLFPLSVDDTASKFAGFSHVFDLPPERIEQPIYITDDVTDPDRRFDRYVLIGDQVHADANPVFAMCRYRPPVIRWSPTFRMATITSLAAALCLAMAHDRALSEKFQLEAYGPPSQQYRGGQMAAAIAADAYATPPRKANWGNNPLARGR